MRELSFNGFLRKYIDELSYQGGENLCKLALEADTRNPRLKEPLVLYAYFVKDSITVKRQFSDSTLYYDYCEFSTNYPEPKLAMEYLKRGSIPDSYQKVYRSYVSRRDRQKYDNEFKESLRVEIQTALRDKNVTAYELLQVQSLELNKGNFYAFLRGKTNSMSTNDVYRVLKYLKNLEKLKLKHLQGF